MAIWHLTITSFERLRGTDFGEWTVLAQGASTEWTDARGHIIVAATEADARKIACDRRGRPSDPEPWWLDQSLTKCVEIKDDGKPRIVLTNMPTG